jgi:uncharacterized protein
MLLYSDDPRCIKLSDFQFYEQEKIPEGQVFFDGMPDTGLVGTIAAQHIVATKNMALSSRIDSDLLPPVAVVKDMDLLEPMAVYRSEDLSVLTSEVPIPTEIAKPFAKELVAWISSKKFRAVISLGGLADPKRPETDTPEVLYVTNAKKAFLSEVDLGKLKPLDSAFLVGSKAAFLLECFRAQLPTLAIFAQSFPNYPDPGASASALGALSGMKELKVDLTDLVKSGEEMRVRFRDLMRRTSGEMERAQKSRELESPSLVV